MKINKFAKKYIYPYIIDIILLVIIFMIIFVKFPYVVYKPGGAISLNDRLLVNDKNDINGSYSMSYVSVSEGNIPSVLASFLFKDWDLVKLKDATFENTDYDTTFKIEQFEMQNAMDRAKIIACQKTDCEVKIDGIKAYVVNVTDEAKTNIKLLDEVIEIDNIKYSNTKEFKKNLENKKVGEKINIKTDSGDKYATIYESNDNQKLLGIGIIEKIIYATSPDIKISSKSTEAGSSGGLMLTLSLYDALSEEDLAKGRNIMGTGTIEDDETVGGIGGVKYKLLGAQKAHADIYFIPKENYKEAKEIYKKYKLSFKLVQVSTLDDAINYLKMN